MKIYDIDNLKKENNEYDLFTRTYRYVFNGIRYSEYKVQKGEEMRIDLVCQSIYGNIDYIDIILNVNNISNPLNIKEGTILKYPNSSDIETLRFKETNNSSEILANPNKSNKKDKFRIKYGESGSLLNQPNILQNQVNQISKNGSLLQIGNVLFNK